MYYRLKEEGITKFRDDRKKIDIPEAINMYNQGMIMADIAKHYGCTVSAISMMLKKHNVTTTRRKTIMSGLIRGGERAEGR